MNKFFCIANLHTDKVTGHDVPPWESYQVSIEDKKLPKDDYRRKLWDNPEANHCLFYLASGQNESYRIDKGNQAAVLYGFMADYDAETSVEHIEQLKRKSPGPWKPTYWGWSHKHGLHLVWMFDRPIPVACNEHANDLLHMIAIKLKAVKWAEAYDVSMEHVTQPMDIGSGWFDFVKNATVPASEIMAWDSALFEKNVDRYVEHVVRIPFEVVVAEIQARARKGAWPHDPPDSISVHTRCVRFWDPSADNQTGAEFMEDGIKIWVTGHENFVTWEQLLGKEFCSSYASTSMAPFTMDTFYYHLKNEFWRYLPADDRCPEPRFEKRMENVLRSEIAIEAMRSKKPDRSGQSQVDRDIFDIRRHNSVDAVLPILYRPAGRIYVPDIKKYVLNTSLVTVAKPANTLMKLPDFTVPEGESVDAETVSRAREEAMDKMMSETTALKVYRDNPSLCSWGNPFAVSGFPNIHRFMTCLFMNQKAYNHWADNGYKLEGQKFLDDKQLTILITWMSIFYKNAARQAQNPDGGLILFLAGNMGAGKSFFARELLGQLMGGSANAGGLYLGNQRFTDSEIKAPIHLIDDMLGSQDFEDRKKFCNNLKVMAANNKVRYEMKFGSAESNLPWPGRVVILMNDNVQSLSIIPDLNKSVKDKFVMLRLGTGMYRFGSRDENQKWLVDEIPYLGKFLLGWKVPEWLRDNRRRYGMKAWQHDDMVSQSTYGSAHVFLEALKEAIRKATGDRDDKGDKSDMSGYVLENVTSVEVKNWILERCPILKDDVKGASHVGWCLQTLVESEQYNIMYDSKMKTYSIAYDLVRRKPDECDEEDEAESSETDYADGQSEN